MSLIINKEAVFFKNPDTYIKGLESQIKSLEDGLKSPTFIPALAPMVNQQLADLRNELSERNKQRNQIQKMSEEDKIKKEIDIIKEGLNNAPTVKGAQASRRAIDSLQNKLANLKEEKKAEKLGKDFTIKGADEIKRTSGSIESAQEIEAEQADAAQQQARQTQQSFISQLQEQSAGTADTAAQKALREAQARSNAQRRAMQASQATTTSAGLRSAQRAADMGQATQNQQSQQLRVQEQLAARQQLANALQGQRAADIGQLQFQKTQASDALGREFGLRQAQQQASSRGAILDVEERLAEQGATLQRDVARMQADAAKKRGMGSAIGSIGGAIIGAKFGMPGVGASIGGNIGRELFNKGGKVEKPKKDKKSKISVKMSKNMDKDTKFGFKKALESNTKGGKNYSTGGDVIRFTGDDPPPLTTEAAKAMARNIEGVDDMVAGERKRRSKAESRSKQAKEQSEDARAMQANLAQQFLAAARGEGPSLANVNLKAQSDQSLAQQMAAAQSGKRAMAPEQLQRAIAGIQQQQAAQIAQQAGQLAAQEAQQAQQLGIGVTGGMRGQDIQQQQLAQMIAAQEAARQAQIAQSQQQAAAALESLKVDEKAAVQAANATRAAAREQAGGGGILSGITDALGFDDGGVVPGKAKVKGDDERNDTVPAMLSPGEIVIPRTVVQKGEKAMMGFIKGLKAMESTKAQKGKKVKNAYKGFGLTDPNGFNEGAYGVQDAIKDTNSPGIINLEPENTLPKKTAKDKIDPTKAQLIGNIASQGLGILGANEKMKRDLAEKEKKFQMSEFKRALARIRGRRNFAHGGMVGGYGSVLEAKRKYKKDKK